MKSKSKTRPVALLAAVALLLSGCQSSQSEDSNASTTVSDDLSSYESSSQEQQSDSIDVPESINITRTSLLSNYYQPKEIVTPHNMHYALPTSDLSNVYIGGFYLNDDEKSLLAKNSFCLTQSYEYEFFQMYESNRYSERANYITVDSMMHTYHLYFAHLLKNIEHNHLVGDMTTVSQQMLQNAEMHYNTLVGTEWEEAARVELAFFAVGMSLLNPDTVVPTPVTDLVETELAAINNASGIGNSSIFGVLEDYSQYIPRGYYDTSEDLKRYFRAMMWYGRMGFNQSDETLNRASVLVTMALKGEALQLWNKTYAVTSFFAGASDDFSYYELKPIIDDVYGEEATVEALIDRDDLWTAFCEKSQTLPPPRINSVPVYETDSDEEAADKQKGFRFMGQRFSIDQASFTQLVYRQVRENENGERRLLPDTLDFPAVLGSDTALKLLQQEGKTNYPNYQEQLEKVRTDVASAPEETWTANLYSAWIHTLRPLLDEKGENYPPYMQTDAWRRKSLLTFAGSYAELKHDTILYSKQMMGEMGGGDIPEYDDRGYVEPEPLVFTRLEALVSATAKGLSDYNYLSDADRKNLAILTELSGRLRVIAEKELSGELPTDEEFDLIRSFGGQLEHFWEEVMRAEYPDEQYHSPQSHPAPIIADIATDPNGYCLEIGTGLPMEMMVIVEVDGMLKIASGPVYSFYQFEQPLSERLTDSKWRQMLGCEITENQIYEPDDSLQYPDWYSDLVYVYNQD